MNIVGSFFFLVLFLYFLSNIEHFPESFLTYICRGGQLHNQPEFPAEPRERQHRSSERRGLLERGTQDRQRLWTRKRCLNYILEITVRMSKTLRDLLIQDFFFYQFINIVIKELK